MAIYSVNQNRQFYVVKKVLSEAEAELGLNPMPAGSILPVNITDENQVFFKYKGAGGITRTDLIDLDKIMYAKFTSAEKMQRKLKTATIALNPDVNNGNPIVGQDYVLRLQINNFLAPGDANVYIKSNAVRVIKDVTDTPATFYAKMVESLTKNFARENANNKALKFEATEDGIVISEEANQPWRLGVLSQEPVNFEVIPTTVTYEGEEVQWGTVTYGEVQGVTVGNGTKIADLEYFCMAERGDMFRNMGWPNNIDVKYLVDPTKEYDVLDVHYYFSGDGVNVHKSEKDITFVVEKGDEAMDDLKDAFTGITIQ